MNKVERMMQQNRDEYGINLPENEAREFAELQLKDLERKGCNSESGECYKCKLMDNCPLCSWEKTHPEYANDELAQRIKVLENKSRNEWKAKRKAEVLAEFKNKNFNVLTESSKIFDAILEYNEINLKLNRAIATGASDDEQLSIMSKLSIAFDKIRSNPLNMFLEKTKIFG